MTSTQIEAAIALACCTFLPGSWDKRFAKHVGAIALDNPNKELTDKQLSAFIKLLNKYRKQLGGLHHFRAVHGEKLLRQFDDLFGSKPDLWSAVLGGTDTQPRPCDAVLGSQAKGNK